MERWFACTEALRPGYWGSKALHAGKVVPVVQTSDRKRTAGPGATVREALPDGSPDRELRLLDEMARTIHEAA